MVPSKSQPNPFPRFRHQAQKRIGNTKNPAKRIAEIHVPAASPAIIPSDLLSSRCATNASRATTTNAATSAVSRANAESNGIRESADEPSRCDSSPKIDPKKGVDL